MKIVMEFNRRQAEISVGMAMGGLIEVAEKMTDKELVEKAFRHASVYGFCNMEILKTEDEDEEGVY